MDAHRIVGGDRSVEERPARFAAIFGAKLFEDLVFVPKPQNGALPGREIDLGFDLFKRRHERTSLFDFSILLAPGMTGLLT